MTEVHRFDGAPGAGKSHKLREYVSKEAERGYGLNDIYYLTFTRSGRTETAEKLAEVFPDAEEEDRQKRARTVHGAAWIACAIGGLWVDDADVDQVIQRGSDDAFYQRFASRHGLRYVGERNPLRKASEGEDTDGTADKLFAINDWLTLTRKPISEFHKAPTQLSIPADRVETLLEAWEAYKMAGPPSHGEPVYEHGDYVDVAIENGYTPDGQILFIDEFQDLSPQEYLLFKQWRDSGHFDRIYIAGDPNQSIYGGFRAGTPMYFEETPVDHNTELKESYRCPKEVTSVASGILDACEETDPRGFTGLRSGGMVKSVRHEPGQKFAGHVSRLASEYASGDGVMLLTRANYQVKAIAKVLRNHGVPYEYLGARNSIWQKPLPALLEALRGMKYGAGGISTTVAERLVANAPQSDDRWAMLGKPMGTVYKAESLWNAFPEYDSVGDIAMSLSLDSKYRTELLRSAVENDQGVSPGNVRVGTIHASKGLEADAVMLFDGYTSTLEDEYRKGDIRAEEHRLYYVGATRAIEELYVVRDFFNGPTAPPLPRPLPSAWEVTA